ASRGNDRHLPANQIGRKRRCPIVLSIRPAIFDCYVPTFDETGFAQSLVKRSKVFAGSGRRAAIQEADRGHRLLCSGRQRPSCGCAAEKGNELASPDAEHGFSTMIAIDGALSALLCSA